MLLRSLPWWWVSEAVFVCWVIDNSFLITQISSFITHFSLLKNTKKYFHPCLATKPTSVFFPKNSKKLSFLWDPWADHCVMPLEWLPADWTLFICFALSSLKSQQHFPNTSFLLHTSTLKTQTSWPPLTSTPPSSSKVIAYL